MLTQRQGRFPGAARPPQRSPIPHPDHSGGGHGAADPQTADRPSGDRPADAGL